MDRIIEVNVLYWDSSIPGTEKRKVANVPLNTVSHLNSIISNWRSSVTSEGL